MVALIILHGESFKEKFTFSRAICWSSLQQSWTPPGPYLAAGYRFSYMLNKTERMESPRIKLDSPGKTALPLGRRKFSPKKYTNILHLPGHYQKASSLLSPPIFYSFGGEKRAVKGGESCSQPQKFLREYQ